MLRNVTKRKKYKSFNNRKYLNNTLFTSFFIFTRYKPTMRHANSRRKVFFNIY